MSDHFPKIIWRQWRQWREGEEISAPMWVPGPHESHVWVESLTRAHAELETRRKRHGLERGEG